jgi:uncharacterized protein YciI
LAQFLYRIQPIRPGFLDASTPEEDRIVGEHFRYLQQLAEEGTVLLAGRTLNADSSSFGIVIFQVSSELEARRVMNDDPAVQKGIFRATLFPYHIAIKAKRWIDGEPGP